MYTKIVQSGTLVEVYQYEKSPPEYRQRKKSRFKNPKRYKRNVERSRSSFVRLVSSNLDRAYPPAFLTLTMRDVVTLREGWRAFTLFAQRAKYYFKGAVDFVAVPEFQERGAVHFHCIVWGLPEPLACMRSSQFYYDRIGKRKRVHLCPPERLCEQHTRVIAALWSHGFVDCFETDASPELAGYMGKYFWKAMYDARLRGQKSYSASRSLCRSVHIRQPAAVSFMLAEISGHTLNGSGELVENVHSPLVPLREVEYDTQWLGKCNYKLFKF